MNFRHIGARYDFCNRRRFCVKNLSRTAYKAIGVTVGVNGFS